MIINTLINNNSNKCGTQVWHMGVDVEHRCRRQVQTWFSCVWINQIVVWLIQRNLCPSVWCHYWRSPSGSWCRELLRHWTTPCLTVTRGWVQGTPTPNLSVCAQDCGSEHLEMHAGWHLAGCDQVPQHIKSFSAIVWYFRYLNSSKFKEHKSSFAILEKKGIRLIHGVSCSGAAATGSLQPAGTTLLDSVYWHLHRNIKTAGRPRCRHPLDSQPDTQHLHTGTHTWHLRTGSHAHHNTFTQVPVLYVNVLKK